MHGFLPPSLLSVVLEEGFLHNAVGSEAQIRHIGKEQEVKP